MARVIARKPPREDPADVLAGILRENAVANSRVQFSNPYNTGLPAARDIMLSLEMVSKQHGIDLAIANTTRLARALCPFACDAIDEQVPEA